jgi:GNAT superfamily N-acetyltransferase
LWRDPVLHAIPLGEFARHGFEGTTIFHGANDEAGLVLLCSVDRGRALVVGDPQRHLAALVELLEATQLRFLLAPPPVADALAGLPGPAAQLLLHRPYEIEQEMVLQPAHLMPHQAPEGVSIGIAAPASATATSIEKLLSFVRTARAWSGETAASLGRRMQYGLVCTAAGPDGSLIGAGWGNPALPSHPRLSKLYVAEEWRGRGVGAALITAMCSQFVASGASAVLAWVRQRDHAGRRAAGKAGFLPGPLWKKIYLGGARPA